LASTRADNLKRKSANFAICNGLAKARLACPQIERRSILAAVVTRARLFAVGRRNPRYSTVQHHVWPCVHRAAARENLSQNNITTNNTKNSDASTVSQCPACFQHSLSQCNITINLTTAEPGGRNATSPFTLQHYAATLQRT